MKITQELILTSPLANVRQVEGNLRTYIYFTLSEEPLYMEIYQHKNGGNYFTSFIRHDRKQPSFVRCRFCKRTDGICLGIDPFHRDMFDRLIQQNNLRLFWLMVPYKYRKD